MNNRKSAHKQTKVLSNIPIQSQSSVPINISYISVRILLSQYVHPFVINSTSIKAIIDICWLVDVIDSNFSRKLNRRSSFANELGPKTIAMTSVIANIKLFLASNQTVQLTSQTQEHCGRDWGFVLFTNESADAKPCFASRATCLKWHRPIDL